MHKSFILKVLNKYILVVLGIILVSSIDVNAQEIKVKSFSLQMEPMTVPMQRTDANGNVCALVKVIMPHSSVSFEGNIIGECKYKVAEYWCYLSPGSKHMKVKISDCEPLMVKFEYPLETKHIYELVLAIPQSTFSEITDSIVSVNRMKTLMRNLSQTDADIICFRRGKLFPYYIRENGNQRVGFLDRDFNIAFTTNYIDFANSSHSVNDVDYSVDIDYHWVVDSNGFWGLIDSNGNKISPSIYTKIYESKDELGYARIVLALDSLEQGFILNRITGEVMNRIPKWDFVNDGYYSKRPTRLLKYTDINNHKDYFIDKITGLRVDVKIPKGYVFKEFLPFNHLRFQKSKSLEQKILNSDGRVISEHLFSKRVFGDESLISPQFLFGILGIYDLERERFLYNGGTISDYRVISRNIIEITNGVHKEYLSLDSGSISDVMPNNKSNEHDTSELSSIRIGLTRIFGNSFYTVIPVEKGIYLAQSTEKKILIDKYGSFVNDNLEISTIPHWEDLYH